MLSIGGALSGKRVVHIIIITALLISLGLLVLGRSRAGAEEAEWACLVQQPLRSDLTGPVLTATKAPFGDDDLLLGTGVGLFRYDLTKLVKVPGDATGPVRDVLELDTGVALLQTDNGLFRYDGNQSIKVVGGATEATIVLSLSKELLLGTRKGLFRLNGTQSSIVPGESVGSIYDGREEGNGLLIGAANGLFRYDGNRISKVIAEPTGEVDRFLDTSTGLVMSGRNGLFRLEQGRLVRILGGALGPVKATSRAYSSDDLFGASNGLFRYDGKRAVRVEGDATGSIAKITETPAGTFISAQRGLFLYENKRVTRLIGGEIGSVNKALSEGSSGALLGTSRGLFRYNSYNGRREISQVPGDEVGAVSAIYDTYGGTIVEGANGLFQDNNSRVAHIIGDGPGSRFFWVRGAQAVFANRQVYSLTFEQSPRDHPPPMPKKDNCFSYGL